MSAITSWIVAVSASVFAACAVYIAREVRNDLRGFTQTVRANEYRSTVSHASLKRREEIVPEDRVEAVDRPEEVAD